MLKYLKPYTEAGLQKILRNLPRINPNIITIAGLVPPALFFYFMIYGRYGWAIVFYVGTLFDLIDGAYARATNQATKFGAVLDASLDRVSDALIISAFGFSGLVSWWLCIALLTASMTISYVKARAEAHGADGKALSIGPIERSERLVIMLIGLILFTALSSDKLADQLVALQILNYVFIILLTLSVITVLRRLFAAHKALQ